MSFLNRASDLNDSFRSKLTIYAPTRGVILILSISLIAWGVWVALPFAAFANPVYATLLTLASEQLWGFIFYMTGLMMGAGIVLKQTPLIQTGSIVGFIIWLGIGILLTIASPTSPAIIIRATIAILHAWVYLQSRVHPALMTGEVTIPDLEEFNKTQNKENK